MEEDLEIGKDSFGLDQSQVRLYHAILRHTILVMATLAICAVTAADLNRVHVIQREHARPLSRERALHAFRDRRQATPVMVGERAAPRSATHDGARICRRIVAAGGETRVLMLTAAAGIRDRVDGLDLGADDYLTKPFAFAELVARVGSLGRRARLALPPVLERAGIRLDQPRRQAWRDGLLLELTPKEFEVLMRAEGSVVSAEELLEEAWDENADPFTNAVRVAVMTLRRKLGQPPVIETIPGAGYRLGS